MSKNHLSLASAEYLKKLRQFESPDTTFVANNFPIVMKKAKGVKIVDVDDKEYLDLTACFGVLALGHNPEIVVETVKNQVGNLIHGMGDVHPSVHKINLLEFLSDIVPLKNAKSILSQSGGEAVESALKTAIRYTKRQKFLSVSGGYHGLHLGPLALSDREYFRDGLESWLEHKVKVLPFPVSEEHYGALWEEGILKEKREELFRKENMKEESLVLEEFKEAAETRQYAGFVIELVQGRGGERPLSRWFVKEAQKICQETGTLLIVDEIFTGFGRTGSLFACEVYDIIPDILCIGKALGGGFPLSACISSLMDEAWSVSEGEARHTSTFLGHPLACAVGHAFLQELRAQLPLVQKNAIFLEAEVDRFLAKVNDYKILKTGQGFLYGLWFYEEPEGFAARLMVDLLQEGIVILPSGARGNTLSICPPFIVEPLEYQLFFQTLEKILSSYKN